jgi:ElaB/YqjD/DUF883 family membrane-anchored ribosome-binding protein
MTTEDVNEPAGSPERRIDNAVDAIRGMSHDLADEVAPRPAWIDQVGDFTREAPIQSLAIGSLIGVLLARR